MTPIVEALVEHGLSPAGEERIADLPRFQNPRASPTRMT